MEILQIDSEGTGLGRVDGKEVRVSGALPGEKVLISVEHEGARRLVGRLRRVITASPDRAPSPCPRTDACEGCPLISMNYPAQLSFKETKVRESLGRYPSLQHVPVRPTWGAPQTTGYRTHAKLVVGKERGVVRIGLYRRGTHEIVDISGCPVHHPLINRIVEVVREEVTRQGIYTYNPERKSGLLRYLTVRVSPASDRAMVTFVTAQRNFREMTHLAKWLKKKAPEIVSIQENINAAEGNYIFGRETLKVLGMPDLLDQVGEVRLRISPTSFFQVNHDQAARLYGLVRSWAGMAGHETALDLYCGIGGIALHLAADAGRVIGIEAVEDAVRNARENARLNGRRNCTFLAGDVADLLEDLETDVPPGAVAVVNPPRGGCEPRVMETLGALKPRLILYVSCSPETLGRDLDFLAGLGYETEAVQPVDMFPQTPHVESVARLVPIRRDGKKGRG